MNRQWDSQCEPTLQLSNTPSLVLVVLQKKTHTKYDEEKILLFWPLDLDFVTFSRTHHFYSTYVSYIMLFPAVQYLQDFLTHSRLRTLFSSEYGKNSEKTRIYTYVHISSHSAKKLLFPSLSQQSKVEKRNFTFFFFLFFSISISILSAHRYTYG